MTIKEKILEEIKDTNEKFFEEELEKGNELIITKDEDGNIHIYSQW